MSIAFSALVRSMVKIAAVRRTECGPDYSSASGLAWRCDQSSVRLEALQSGANKRMLHPPCGRGMRRNIAERLRWSFSPYPVCGDRHPVIVGQPHEFVRFTRRAEPSPPTVLGTRSRLFVSFWGVAASGVPALPVCPRADLHRPTAASSSAATAWRSPPGVCASSRDRCGSAPLTSPRSRRTCMR